MESIYNTQSYQQYINYIYGKTNNQKKDNEEKSYQADMHIHSRYSKNSNMELSDIIKILEKRKKKILYAGIADSVNFSNEPVAQVIERIKKRNAEIDALQEKTEIKILKGIEVGEPHLYQKEMARIEKISDLDFVIGSIKEIKRTDLSIQAKHDRNIVKKYYEEIINMLKFSQIDIVGHLDYIKKFANVVRDPDILYDILSIIANSNIALEINTSDLLEEKCTYPADAIIQEFVKLGGKRVTYGSDAQTPKMLDSSIESKSKENKSLKLTEGVVINHKFKNI